MPDGLCQCGCGQRTKLAEKTRTNLGWIKGRPIPYVRGHHGPTWKRQWILRECTYCHRFLLRRRVDSRFCSLTCSGKANQNIRREGEANANYNGGLSFNSHEQRWAVCCRDGTQMRYSRAVMAGHVGRLLTRHELVHHINENTTDDRIENLELVDHTQHYARHREQILEARWGKAA